jgi:hypothetical protein
LEGIAEMIKELETYGKTYEQFTGGDNGVYVSRILDALSRDRLVDFIHEHALCQMSEKDIDELHCTIMYSPTGIDPEHRDNDLNPIPLPCSARVVRFEFWEGHDEDGYLVAVLNSPTLNSLHRLWKLRGCISTFSEYRPHITLQTPFEEYKGLTHRMKLANEAIIHSPIVIRLIQETIEDIKKSTLISSLEAIKI